MYWDCTYSTHFSMFVLLYNHIHNLCVSDTLLCIIDSVLVCMFESFLLLVQNLHQWSTTEIKFVSPAISRLYMNKVQLVPQEHFLLTALLTTCFQWRLGPIKQDSVSWTSSYWYEIPSIGRHWIIVTRTLPTLRIFLLNHSLWTQIWMPP